MARRRETQVRRAMAGKWEPVPGTWRVVVRRERETVVEVAEAVRVEHLMDDRTPHG